MTQITETTRANFFGTVVYDSTGHNSSIYFTKKNFKEERIRNLIQRKNSTDLLVPSAIKRRNWVSELKRNTVSPNAYTEEQLSDILM